MNTPTTLLPNSPGQTCIALGANYSYGKQGLPDLPTRLRPNKRHNSTSKCPTRPSSAGLAGPDSNKRKTTTTTITSTTLNKNDLFPSSYRPYDDKTLFTSTLTNSAALANMTKGRCRIPATLSGSSNESTSSSNSNSTIIISGRRIRSNDSKKVVVIKKNSKRKSKVNHDLIPTATQQANVMEKSSTPPAEPEKRESLTRLKKRKNKGLREKARKVATTAEDDSQPKSMSLLLSSPPRDSTSSVKDMDDSENNSCKEDGNNNDNCMMNRISMRSRPATENVRCAGLPLLKQRLGYLWEKKMFTDVVFLVGRNKRKIEAHRVILASCSEVFQNLLYGEGKPLQNSDGKYILHENDFSESALEVFIKTMYTNEIPICLTLAMALEVFYATKKYAVIFLEDQVLEHIRQLLTVSNVFEALRFSTNAVELTYLAPICWRIVEEKTAEVLEYHLEDLEVHLFTKILERDRLSVDEVQLFQFAVRWAANLCKVNGMKVTGKNKRHFMEPLLKHFRFTTMSLIQFNEVVAPSRILEPREILQIQSGFNKVADLKSIALPYKTTPRVNTATQVEHRQSSPTESFTRMENSKNSIYSNFTKLRGCNMDGSGDGQHLQMIRSDSAVIAPGLGSKTHFSSSKKGTSSTKLKNRRVPSSHGKAR